MFAAAGHAARNLNAENIEGQCIARAGLSAAGYAASIVALTIRVQAEAFVTAFIRLIQPEPLSVDVEVRTGHSAAAVL